jgi:hypothetical protein
LQALALRKELAKGSPVLSSDFNVDSTVLASDFTCGASAELTVLTVATDALVVIWSIPLVMASTVF